MVSGPMNNVEPMPNDDAAGRFRRVIAIDGPAAAGKSTVARAVAERLGATLFDTGTLYRTLTLAAIREGISAHDAVSLATLANDVTIAVRPPSVPDGRLYDVVLNGEDVTWAIRDTPVETRVSAVSAVPAVRAALLPVQRRIATENLVVMVGRDIGSVVVPEAGLKIYLDASAEERALRRCRELRERGEHADYGAILKAMRARDKYDTGRESAPLKVAEDAVIIATDGRTIADIVDEIVTAAQVRGIAASASQARSL